MNITFLGTAAATSCPLAFCRCDFCNKARKLGGKDYRKRSSIIINNDLLVDFGPDVLSASFVYGKSIADIRYLLQTHSHSDHFDPSHFTTRIPEYMGVNIPPLHLFGSEATLKKMSEMVKNEGYVSDIFDPKEKQRLNLEITSVRHLQTFNFGNYHVTAFATDHDNSVDSLLYSITEGDFTVFYGTDTDILSESVWQGIKDKNLKFNVVILDHTYGPNADGGGHLNVNRYIEHVKRFKSENLLTDNARILATHLSHEGNQTHEELSKYARQIGYEIAYDGLMV
jgi:phosphoribosyl 1,2-cyclic phosphate phosphodiesterase